MDTVSPVPRFLLIIRYGIAGGIAAFVNVAVLYGCTEYLGFHYLVSVSIAFLVSFVVSFSLQKYWTFKDHRTEGISRQGRTYFLVSVANYVLNLLLLYVCVEIVHLWYVLAQILISGGLACSSFIIYRYRIFAMPGAPTI